MSKNLNIRIRDDEDVLLNELARRYRISKSKLMRLAIKYIQKNMPILEIAPTAIKDAIE